MTMHGDNYPSKDAAFAAGVRTGLRHADADAAEAADDTLDYHDLTTADIRNMSVEEINTNWDAVSDFLAGGSHE